MKNYSHSLCSPLGNEQGSVIVAAIFVLVLVTIIAITATNTSTLEMMIASNDQFVKMAFYNADGAVSGTAKLISHAVNRSGRVDAGAGNDAPGLTYLSTASVPAEDFYRQIAGYDVHDGTEDVDFNIGGIDAQTDAKRVRQGYVGGGGAEFATGSEGVGGRAIAIYYDIYSNGFSNRQINRNLIAAYRKMVGIPGGL